MPKNMSKKKKKKKSCFSTYCHNSTQTMKLKPNQTLFDRA